MIPDGHIVRSVRTDCPQQADGHTLPFRGVSCPRCPAIAQARAAEREQKSLIDALTGMILAKTRAPQTAPATPPAAQPVRCALDGSSISLTSNDLQAHVGPPTQRSGGPR